MNLGRVEALWAVHKAEDTLLTLTLSRIDASLIAHHGTF